MALMASDVKLPNDLSTIFQGIGGGASSGIGNVYNQLKSRYANDARGITPGGPNLGPNSYGGQRFGAQQGLDIGSLEAGLGGELGSTAYKDTLNQRDYNQQMQLANATADAMRPGLLQQIFAGIGGGAKAGGSLYSLYNMMPRRSNGGDVTGDPSLSLFNNDRYNSGY